MDVNNHSCVNHENMIVSLTLFDNIFVQIVNLLLPIKETLAAFWLLVSSPVSVVRSGATRALQFFLFRYFDEYMLLIGLHLKLGCLVAKNSGLKIYSFKALIV